MSAQNGILPRRCLNKMCRQTDVTDFSTCRYCGARYDGKSDRPVQQLSAFDRMAQNPMTFVKIAMVIGTLVSSVYLSSVFGPGTGHGRRSGSIPSIPAAFIYYFGSKMATNAQNNVVSQTEVLRTDPNNYAALVSRGDAHYTRLDMGEALSDYTAAVNAKPDMKEAHEKRAIIYDAMGNYDMSAKDRSAAASCNH